MPKNAYYFPHDSNARHDPKILKMRSHYKLEGLGLYWAIIEMMREQEDYYLPIDDDSIEGYALDLNCPIETLKTFIKDCISSFNLFQSDNNIIWSDSLIRRMVNFDEKSLQGQEAAQIRWGKNKAHNGRNADALPTQSDSNNEEITPENNDPIDTNNADALPTQSDGNAKRLDNIKRDNKRLDNIIPDFLDKELWNDFLEMRKKKKIPYTERAIKLLIRKLTEFHNNGLDANKSLEESIMSGWSGIFPPKDNKYGTNKENNSGNGQNNNPDKYTKGQYGSFVRH
jgi:hypothetical protein